MDAFSNLKRETADISTEPRPKAGEPIYNPSTARGRSDRVATTYWSSLKYVKPTKGNWFPTKALGVGNVSTSPLSSSISSKLLVSMSLLSSGTTGATADGGGEEKEKVSMAGGKKRKKRKCCVNKFEPNK